MTESLFVDIITNMGESAESETESDYYGYSKSVCTFC